LKNKTKIPQISTIVIILILTLSAILVTLPLVNAHDPAWTIETYAYMEAFPNPIGVDQTIYIGFWLDKVPPTAIGTYGVRWHNIKMTITKPNGDTEVLGPFDSDQAGGAWTTYVPDQVGTYKVVGDFPGQTIVEENPYPSSYEVLPIGVEFTNDTYTANSATTYFVVQQEPIATTYPPNPLPTEYWTRPINSMNREWYSIAGNWLGLGVTIFGDTGTYDQNGNFNPYTIAPNSAHVVWTKPIAFGGQIGGEFGDTDTSLYATGTAYEPKFSPVVLQGILYYTAYPGAMNNPGPLTAVDIRTGQTLWTKNANGVLKVGMIYNFITGNQYGAHAYLLTGPSTANGFVVPPDLDNKWSMYDAMTGDWILDIANASAGKLVRGENGEILSYTVAGGMLTLWNSSKCIIEGSLKHYFYIVPNMWRPPQGATIDWNNGYEWSVPIDTNISGVPITPDLHIEKISDGVILAAVQPKAYNAGALWFGNVPGGSQLGWQIEAGYSAVDGHLLWGPINRTLTPWTTVFPSTAGEGVYTIYTLQTMTWNGYNIKTGEKLWGPISPKNSSWGYYDYPYCNQMIGYGNLYAWGLGGEVYCFDVKTGEQKWSWNAGSAGFDTPYGTWPLGTFGQSALADGKLYVASGHDYTPPVFKGAKIYCLNATTGEEIWSSLCFNMLSGCAVTDGILVKHNGYDNQIYAYGKGPSDTSVSAAPKVTVKGSSVVIEGTVMDISPGTEDAALRLRFPDGVPAISDEDQSKWMDYLYQQQPKPEDATGVEVFIKILDPNGDYYSATVTADSNGVFSHMWAPAIAGEYHVTAMFEGSESYYPSQKTATFGVDEAAAAGAPSAAEIAQTTVNQMPAYPAIPEIPAYLTIDLIILIIAAVGVVIGLIAYMALRKQK